MLSVNELDSWDDEIALFNPDKSIVPSETKENYYVQLRELKTRNHPFNQTINYGQLNELKSVTVPLISKSKAHSKKYAYGTVNSYFFSRFFFQNLIL